VEPITIAIFVAAAVSSTLVIGASSFNAYKLAGTGTRQDKALEAFAKAQGGVYEPGGISQRAAAVVQRPVGKVRLQRASPAQAEAGLSLQIEITLSELLPGFSLRPKLVQLGMEALLAESGTWSESGALNSAYRILKSDPETTEALLTGEPSRGTSLLRVVRGDWPEHPEALTKLVDTSCALGQALVDRWLAPWLAASLHWKLKFVRIPGSYSRSLEGQVEGFRISVHELHAVGRPITEIVILQDSIHGLRIAHKDHARLQGWLPLAAPVGNPVVDMMLAAKASDRGLLERLLADEELTAALLEVLHGHPGSELSASGLKLQLRGHLARDLLEPVEQALTLARALRARMVLNQTMAPSSTG
jgi:hypothetical protein